MIPFSLSRILLLDHPRSVLVPCVIVCHLDHPCVAAHGCSSHQQQSSSAAVVAAAAAAVVVAAMTAMTAMTAAAHQQQQQCSSIHTAIVVQDLQHPMLPHHSGGGQQENHSQCQPQNKCLSHAQPRAQPACQSTTSRRPPVG